MWHLLLFPAATKRAAPLGLTPALAAAEALQARRAHMRDACWPDPCRKKGIARRHPHTCAHRHVLDGTPGHRNVLLGCAHHQLVRKQRQLLLAPACRRAGSWGDLLSGSHACTTSVSQNSANCCLPLCDRLGRKQQVRPRRGLLCHMETLHPVIVPSS